MSHSPLVLSEVEMKELRGLLSGGGLPGYVHVKALSLVRFGEGMPLSRIASFVGCNRHSVAAWAKAYKARGKEGLWVAKGRGPKSRIPEGLLEEKLRQPPTAFGLMEARWTLSLIRDHIEGLQSYTLPGLWYALRRKDLSYKRAQPRLTSPDPEYAAKKKP